MATSNSLRRKRRMRAVEAPVKNETIDTSEMNIGEKSKLAHELVKNGQASDLKEAWSIIKKS